MLKIEEKIDKKIEKMDKTDVTILNILQENARTSNVDIAKIIGKAPSVSLERIRKLEKKGIIQGYHTRINKDALHYGLLAFVSIRVKISDCTPEFEGKLRNIKGVQEIHMVAGNETYLLKVRARNPRDLADIIKNEFSVLPEVGSTTSTLVLNSVKEISTIPLTMDNFIKVKPKVKKGTATTA